MTIVMYHYVRNMRSAAYPGINGLLVEKFKKQLDYIEKNYQVIALEHYPAYSREEKDLPQSPCVLSFDDGLKDHYTNVFPILKKRGLPACFFPATQPLTDYVVLPVHQAHFLLAKLGGEILAKEFNDVLKTRFSELVKEFFVDNKSKKQKKYRWDDVLTANLKHSIAQMPFLPKTEILSCIFSRHFANEQDFSKQLYMNFSEMKEMLEAGMSFGGHSHTHPALSQLNYVAQLKEVSFSKKILENGLNTKISLFSYPYGDFNKTTINILKQEGFQCALTSDLGVNNYQQDNPFTLKRLDTNDLPQ